MKKHVCKKMVLCLSLMFCCAVCNVLIGRVDSTNHVKAEEKKYLVLIQNAKGEWTGYLDMAMKSPTSKAIIIPAKKISKRLGFLYENLGDGTFRIARTSNRSCEYKRGEKVYTYTLKGKTTSQQGKYPAEYVDERNMVYCYSLTSLCHAKYFSASEAGDYSELGYSGVVCYSLKDKVTALPDVSELTNQDTIVGKKILSEDDIRKIIAEYSMSKEEIQTAVKDWISEKLSDKALYTKDELLELIKDNSKTVYYGGGTTTIIQEIPEKHDWADGTALSLYEKQVLPYQIVSDGYEDPTYGEKGTNSVVTSAQVLKYHYDQMYKGMFYKYKYVAEFSGKIENYEPDPNKSYFLHFGTSGGRYYTVGLYNNSNQIDEEGNFDCSLTTYSIDDMSSFYLSALTYCVDEEGGNEEVDKCDHIYDEGVIKQEQTCIEDGIKLYTCTLCGKTRKEEIPAEHLEVIDPEVEATFTTTGLTEGSHCERCGEIIRKQYEIPPKDIYIQSVSIEENGQTVYAGDTITINVRVDMRNEYLMSTFYLGSDDVDGGSSTFNLFNIESNKLPSDGILKLKCKIPEQVKPGLWYLTSIWVTDYTGDSEPKTLSKEDGYLYIRPKEEAPDPPQEDHDVRFNSISIDKNGETLSVGDVVTITVNADFKYDPRSISIGLKSGVKDSNIKVAVDSINEKSQDGIYTLTLEITDDMYPGIWQLDWGNIYDKYNTNAFINFSESDGYFYVQ